MSGNNFINFLKRNVGFFIGLLIGALVILFNFVSFFVNLAVIIAFGFLGVYIQKNRLKVKSILQNIVDKI